MSFGLLGIVLGLAISIGAPRGQEAMHVLEKASTVTKAAVLAHYFAEHLSDEGYKSYTYHLVVRFNASEREVVLEATAIKAVWDATEVGWPVFVRYADAGPHIALIDREDGF